MGSAPTRSRLHIRHTHACLVSSAEGPAGQALSLPLLTDEDTALKGLVSGELHQRTCVFPVSRNDSELAKLSHWGVSF